MGVSQRAKLARLRRPLDRPVQTARAPFTCPQRKEFTLSHIVQIQTQVRDAEAVRAACHRLGLAAPVEGVTKLFTSTATGLAVQLPGWNYPVVCQLDSGQLQYDDYGGKWGSQVQLQRFLQAYAVERAKLEARKQGHYVTEQPLTDGSVKLTIHL